MKIVRFILSLFITVSCLYAGDEDSLKNVNRNSEEMLFSWTNTSEFNFSGSFKYTFENDLSLKADVVSLRWIKDDSKYRFSATTALTSLGMMVLGFSIFTAIDTSFVKPVCYAVAGFQFLLNPTIEYAIVKKYVPISVALGYNTDWFVFSRNQEFYFKPHMDLNFNFAKYLVVAGSFAYLVTDTYDAKHGPRFEFKIGLDAF